MRRQQEYAARVNFERIVEAQAARTPRPWPCALKTAALSYRELNERANELAHVLAGARRWPGGAGGDAAGTVGGNDGRVARDLQSRWRVCAAGAGVSGERLRFMVHDAGLELVVTQARLTSRLGNTVVQSIRVDADWAEMANEREDNPPLRASAANLAYIIYTSGSRGKPERSHGHAWRHAQLSEAQPRFRRSSRMPFLMRPLCFDPSVWEVLWRSRRARRVMLRRAWNLEGSALLRSWPASSTCVTSCRLRHWSGSPADGCRGLR